MPSSYDHSYCINTFFCAGPENPIDSDVCLDCGARLLVNDRYRLVQMLDKPNAEADKRVYKALDTQDNNKELLLKIISYPDRKLATYLQREYEFLRSVPRPFPKVESGAFFEWLPNPEHDFYITYVLVLPFIEGQDSFDWINQNGKISESQCVEWLLQILEYLEILSEMSIMHRDIKPENVIVTSDGSVKLIDFGTVRRIDTEYLSILEDTALTEDGLPRRGTRLFTFGYSPPEQLQGRAVKQSDYYALGKTVIFWLTGKAPFDLAGEESDDWTQYCPDLSQTFRRFIESLTSNNISLRPLDSGAIRQYLTERYPSDIEFEQRLNISKKQYFLKRIAWISIPIFILLLSVFGISFFYSRQARLSIESGDYHRALGELKIASTLNIFDKNLIRSEAYAYLWNNDTLKSKKKFEQYLRFKPNDAGTLYHLGILNEKLNKTDIAKEFYEKALIAEPVQIESQMRLARLALGDKDIKTAQTYLNQALENTRKFPEKKQLTDRYFLNFYFGWLELEKKNYEASYQYLNAALMNVTDDSNRSSVRSGDVVCLLAETATFLKKTDAISLWTECFMSPTATDIGTNVRITRVNEFIKNSLR